MANLYNEFRLEKLKVMIYPTQTQDSGVGSSNTVWALGYAPQVAASAPASLSDVAELSELAVITSGMSIPSKFVLNHNSLIGPASLKWYHTGGSTNDTKFQGALYFVASGTYSGTWELCIVVQSTWSFRSPVPFGEFLFSRKGAVVANVDADVKVPEVVPDSEDDILCVDDSSSDGVAIKLSCKRPAESAQQGANKPRR